MSQFFSGKLYVEPGADVSIDFDASPKVSALSSSVALVIGESENGLDFSDKKVYAFQTPTTAKSILGAGPALDLIYCLFNPSPQYAGATQVLFVRSNKGSNAVFKTATGSVLKKARYTVTGNPASGRIGFDISIAGSYPVTVYVDITKDLTYALTQLAKQLNQFDGISAEATSTQVTITAAHNCIDFEITTPINPAGATVEVATITEFAPTYDEKAFKLVTKDKGRAINFAFKRSADVFTFYKDGGILTILEGIGSTAQLVEQINNNVILSRVLTASAENLEAALPTTGSVSPLPLTVQPNIPTTFETFNEALSLTYDKAKNFVITHFEDAAYHTAIMEYCTSQSNYACMGFGGGKINEAPSVVMDRAFNLNSEKFVLCYPGVYLNLHGSSELYSPAYHAALACGLACGLECQEPLTRKILNCQGFEDIDLEGMDFKGVREELINSGVLFSYAMEEMGNMVNKGINTVQGQINRQILETDNRTHEISIARIRNQMQNEIRISANKAFPGHTRLYPSKNDVIEFYRSYFNSKVGTYLTGWDDKSLNVYMQEDAWIGSAVVYVNGPVNYSFTTLSFKLDDTI